MGIPDWISSFCLLTPLPGSVVWTGALPGHERYIRATQLIYDHTHTDFVKGKGLTAEVQAVGLPRAPV